MNKFQKERKVLFDGRKLSDKSKLTVIEAVHAPTKQKKQWVPAVVATSIIGIASFLLLVPENEKKIEIAENQQAFTMDEFAKQYEKEWQIKNMELIYEQSSFITKNDGFIIVKEEIDGSPYYHFVRGEFENSQWQIEDQITLFGDNPLQWVPFSLENRPHKVGIIADDQVEKIFVGNEEAIIIEANDGSRVWIARANSEYTPVYKQVSGEKQRIPSFYITHYSSRVQILEPIGNNTSYRYERNTMTRGNNEYNEFPIVIDPYFYAEHPYKIGDVIAIDRDGEMEVTRIISTDKQQNEIIEDTFVYSNSTNQNENLFFLWPTYDGDTGIFKNSHETFQPFNADEVFISPDNWASKGYRGVFPKEKIMGKVLGYDLYSVTNTLTSDELKSYETLKKLVHANQAGKSDESIRQLLIDLTPNTIARLNLYANYLEDYRTMYALFAASDELPLYENWIELTNKYLTKSMKQQLLTKIYLVNQAEMTLDGNKLRNTDPMSQEIILQIPMQQIDGVWKVVYSTITENRQ